MLLGLFAPSRLTQAKLVLGEETGKEQFEDFYDGEEQGVWTESIAHGWKEYFKNLFNPTNMHSKEEEEPENFGLGSLITGVEVAGIVK